MDHILVQGLIRNSGFCDLVDAGFSSWLLLFEDDYEEGVSRIIRNPRESRGQKHLYFLTNPGQNSSIDF